jgi:hypothetical protein
MGIKNFFTGLFGSTDNQMPQSLGQHEQEQQYVVNLGENIEQSKEEEQKQEEKEKPAQRVETYNLIILDESGSMSSVRSQTVSGCNETLNSIRNSAAEDPETKQYVSIFCFDTTNSRYLYQDVLIENTHDLTYDDYCPNSCTPLYDAIGYTVTQLRNLVDKVQAETNIVVTIITDGYENASRRWTHHAVVELIESLKKKGWVFTFIGANIDVEQTAAGLGIDSYSRFEQTDEGMQEMFEEERRSRQAYYDKRRWIRGMKGYASLCNDDREELLGAMNINYFVEKERLAPTSIQTLKEDEVFVFGSNICGEHNDSAALFALKHFGAVMGQAEGIQGQSYAIPTDGNTLDELKAAIERFTDFAVMHPEKKFMFTAIGCGNAGYSAEQIAPLLRQAYSFGNVYIPKEFLPYMKTSPNV